MSDEVTEYYQDLDAALLSMDEKKLRAFYTRWKIRIPSDPEVFWGGVHKAVTSRTRLPIDFRRKSKAYLDIRGLKSWDDGDL